MFQDLEKSSEGDEQHKYNLLLEILTPIAKTYPSEKGIESVNNGLQILGGYGFCSEYILQQYYRDIRISALYEGTTGIQSIDLLGRKMTMENGKVGQLLFAEISDSISKGKEYEQLQQTASILDEKLNLAGKVLNYLLQYAVKKDYDHFLSNATVFMDFMGTLVIGWQWLKIGIAASKGLIHSSDRYTPEFYNSKLKTMEFFYLHEMVKMDGLAQTIQNDPGITIPEETEIDF